MEKQATLVTITATVNAPVDKVWKFWNGPEHITKWNSPSPEWHTPRSENDLRVGGKINSRMEARDGSMGFDFQGTYTAVTTNEYIAYEIADGRKVEIIFKTENGATHITESFEAEGQNPVEFQRAGWQAILDSFKAYAEAN